MRHVERETGRVWLSVGWQTSTPDADDKSFERGAAYAGVLARTLRAAGYEPRHLQLGLQRGGPGVLELHVVADVPGMSGADFESLARVTLNAVTLRRELAEDEDLVLVTRLESPDQVETALPRARVANAAHQSPPRRTQAPLYAQEPKAPNAPPTRHAKPPFWDGFPVGRVVVGVALGLALGVVGLPRLELPTPGGLLAQPQRSVGQTEVATLADDAPPLLAAQMASRGAAARPTRESPPPTLVPTLVPTQPGSASVARFGSNVLFAQRFVTPLVNWPNDPRATAWFEDRAYHMLARHPGRFVAVGVPLGEPLGDGVISAQFHKVDGPAGGGYGFIIRDQGRAADRDSRSQAGRYLVVEVGDLGEVGIWQRDDTRWIEVLPWQSAATVRPDREPNLLMVYTRGPAIRFEVNGEIVADVAYDGIPNSGGVGIFVGGDLNRVALEWMRVEAL